MNQMDCSQYPLEKIEELLKIRPFDKERYMGQNIHYKIFDDWNEVEDFLRINRKSIRHDLSFNCLGYELVHDNHYIKIYFQLIRSYL